MRNPNADKYFAKCKPLRQSENLLHRQLCTWMRLQYDGVLFRSGLEGFKLSETDAAFAALLNNPSKGWPDLLVFEKRNQYCGLALELKQDNAPLFKLDGSLRKSAHLERQSAMLELLALEGWKTGFAKGFEEAQEKITEYLKMPAQ